MRMIKIINGRYRFLYEVEDGMKLKVIKPDGEAFIKTCTYVDDCHFNVGGNLYHSCQFGEFLDKTGYQAEPAGYTLDYRQYPSERYFGGDYFCLQRIKGMAFYYNPLLEQPFLTNELDEFGRDKRSTVCRGKTFLEVAGYDEYSAGWDSAFDIEKLKNIVVLDLPEAVRETEKMELKAEKDFIDRKKAELQEAYAGIDRLAYDEIERMIDTIHQTDVYEPMMIKEQKTKEKFAVQITVPLKVFAEKDFSNCNLKGVDFSGYTFVRCNFTDCMLEKEQCRNSVFIECIMDYEFHCQEKKEGGEHRKDSR